MGRSRRGLQILLGAQKGGEDFDRTSRRPNGLFHTLNFHTAY